MLELILVRHGQTSANAAGLLQGRLDLSLNDLGRAQATRVARVLAPMVSDGARVICSPLRRAQETAQAISPEACVDPAWIELDYGDLDGTPLSDVQREVWDRWRSDEHFAPAGGESHHVLQHRVSAACDQLVAHDADGVSDITEERLVVVSHVSPIKAAVAWAIGAPLHVVWRMHLDQASITRIRIAGGGAVLLGFNNTGHLITQ